MRVFDVGCGTGESAAYANHDVVGIDIDPQRLAIAQQKHPNAFFYAMAAEDMRQLHDEEFDCVISNVAMPYMNIPAALAEMYRVLKPGGELRMTLHPPGFTVRELRRTFPQPKPTLFRLFVLGNGIWFHFTGRVLHLGRRFESCQTRAGITKALKRAGFAKAEFPAANQFVVRARKPGSERVYADSLRVSDNGYYVK